MGFAVGVVQETVHKTSSTGHNAGHCSWPKKSKVCFFQHIFGVGELMCAQQCGMSHMTLDMFCTKMKGKTQNDINCGSGYSCPLTVDECAELAGKNPKDLSTVDQMSSTMLKINNLQFFAMKMWGVGCKPTDIAKWVVR